MDESLLEPSNLKRAFLSAVCDAETAADCANAVSTLYSGIETLFQKDQSNESFLTGVAFGLSLAINHTR